MTVTGPEINIARKQTIRSNFDWRSFDEWKVRIPIYGRVVTYGNFVVIIFNAQAHRVQMGPAVNPYFVIIPVYINVAVRQSGEIFDDDDIAVPANLESRLFDENRAKITMILKGDPDSISTADAIVIAQKVFNY